MTVSHLKLLLRETKLSPEELSARIGVSNMTIRRWLSKPGNKRLPEIYEGALRDATYRLISEGVLDAGSKSVQTLLKLFRSPSFEAALENLGLEGLEQANGGDHDRQMIEGLLKIGSDSKRQGEVEKGRGKILSFGKLGQEWSARIARLFEVIGMKELSGVEKLVAYGALFYLLTPFDLIPDHIPVFGLLDDYAVLGIAVGYYSRRLSRAS